jgi:SAM-dependent methyltransferase
MTAEQRFFDCWSRSYDDSIQSYDYVVPRAVFDAVWPYAQRRIAGDAPLRLCDLGIGTGLTSVPFRETGKVYITGIDISARMLAICRARGVADELHRCDASREILPCADGSFDIVIAGGMLEFVDDAERLFEEIARALAPGGFLALTYETQDSRDLYPPSLFNGILEDEKHRVTVQRSFLRFCLPRLYRKYLHSARVMEDLFILNNIALLQTNEFTAYRWDADREIKYSLMVGQKAG